MYQDYRCIQFKFGLHGICCNSMVLNKQYIIKADIIIMRDFFIALIEESIALVLSHMYVKVQYIPILILCCIDFTCMPPYSTVQKAAITSIWVVIDHTSINVFSCPKTYCSKLYLLPYWWDNVKSVFPVYSV